MRVEGLDINRLFSKSIDDKEYLGNIETEKHRVIAWSGDNEKLAFLLPGKLMVFEIEWLKGTMSEGYELALELNIARVRALREFDIQSKLTSLIFAGNNKEIYLGDKEYVDLESDRVATLEGKLSHNYFGTEKVYPIPGRGGIAYWEQEAQMTLGGEPHIVTNNKGETFKYVLPKHNYDFGGNILFSPGLNHVCFDYGNSGFWGYVIGKIEFRRISELARGRQYSYCVRWLSGNEVLIEESPFNNYGHFITNLM